jgi:hypothetical protein
MLVFLCIGVIIGIIVDLGGDGVSDYYLKLNEYDKRVDADKYRVDKELKLKSYLDYQIDLLTQKRSEVSELLEKLYSYNVIYQKYRNFVAVTTFCEYFESGRCKELEGHEGAYNIYENEIRLNYIITKLDEILYRLDEISSNQYKIYSAVCEGNKTADRIYQNSVRTAERIGNIESNAEIIAYNSKITARNSEIIKFMTLYR